MKHKLLIARFSILIVVALISIPNLTFTQNEIPADFCINQEELKLYNLFNEYRKTMNQPEIPLSKSLCFVAEKHINDLIQNKPDTNTCNFHSWSDKGEWTSCCFEVELKDKSCMQKKPQELTKYVGNAYEIVYWENRVATADKAFDQWRETAASQSMIINIKDWEDHNWNAVGVCIQGNFAIAWLGKEIDVETETKICGTGTVIKNERPKTEGEKLIISEATGRFYLIFGSFSILEDAKEQAKKYAGEGFKKVKIISKDNKFRISLADYSSKELASTSKKELPAKYKEAWVMEY